MIPKGLFSQISMIILAFAIVFTYVKPTFGEIGKIQDDIAKYQAELAGVVYVNSELASHVSSMDSVSIDDHRKLLTYLPNEVDEIAVARDLKNISDLSGAQYMNVKSNGPAGEVEKKPDPKKPRPQAVSFVLSVEGSYKEIKNLFKLMELNHYPLEVQGVTIDRKGVDFLGVEINIFSYAYLDENAGSI